MSRPFLAWSRTISDFQDLRLLLSFLQSWPVNYLWTRSAGLCAFQSIGILQACSTLGQVEILSGKVQKTGRVLIGLFPVLLFGMKSRIALVRGFLRDASCLGSLAEETFGPSPPHRICSGSCGGSLWLRTFSPSPQVR